MSGHFASCRKPFTANRLFWCFWDGKIKIALCDWHRGLRPRKYNPLWEYVQKTDKKSFPLTIEQIQNIAGIPIDHSFLRYKKEFSCIVRCGYVMTRRRRLDPYCSL